MTPGKRRRIYERDGWRCHYCGCKVVYPRPSVPTERRASVDHKHPLSLGGTHVDANLVCACEPCNRHKANMPYDEYMQLIGRLGFTASQLHYIINEWSDADDLTARACAAAAAVMLEL
jgi:5-methylcytosine-specific restriction endonuclease McrA